MRHFRTEDVAPVPRGWKVRTIISGGHRVRLAFPPGRRETGAGMVVQVLHPPQENPCMVRNPAELVLMGGNPLGKKATRERAAKIRAARLKNPYDALSRNERLAFGRLGLGKKQLRTESDIAKARRQVAEVNRLRNHLPNGAGAIESAESQEARELASEFKHAPSDSYQVYDESHVPGGNYSHLGMFVYVAVKPHIGGNAEVKTISFPDPNGRMVSVVDKFGVPYQHPASDVVVIGKKHPIYLVGDQPMTESELAQFNAGPEDPCLLGQGRSIAYIKEKWHPQAPDSIRGKKVVWEHPFGEEGGRKPEVFYSRRMQRLLIKGGDYTVEGVGIKN